MTTSQERHASIWNGMAKIARLLLDSTPEPERRADLERQIAEIEAEIARQEVLFGEEDVEPTSDQKAQIELLRQNQERMDRFHRQAIGFMLLIARKNNWLDDEDIERWEAENL